MAGPFVGMGALIMCDKGVVPLPLVVTPQNRVMGTAGPLANIMDFIPMNNIKPFGICAVLGGLPCVPAIVAPWIVGCPIVHVGPMPALTMQSQAMCALGGQVKILFPGPPTTVIP